jgi:hypothetical protein
LFFFPALAFSEEGSEGFDEDWSVISPPVAKTTADLRGLDFLKSFLAGFRVQNMSRLHQVGPGRVVLNGYKDVYPTHKLVKHRSKGTVSRGRKLDGRNAKDKLGDVDAHIAMSSTLPQAVLVRDMFHPHSRVYPADATLSGGEHLFFEVTSLGWSECKRDAKVETKLKCYQHIFHNASTFEAPEGKKMFLFVFNGVDAPTIESEFLDYLKANPLPFECDAVAVWLAYDRTLTWETSLKAQLQAQKAQMQVEQAQQQTRQLQAQLQAQLQPQAAPPPAETSHNEEWLQRIAVMMIQEEKESRDRDVDTVVPPEVLVAAIRSASFSVEEEEEVTADTDR